MISAIKKYCIWFWSVSAHSRLPIFVLSFISILRVVLALAFVYVCKSLIDIATHEVVASLPHYIFALVAILLSELFINALRYRISALTGVMLQNSIRHRLFQQLIYTRHTGRFRRHTGDVVNRMEEDVQIVKDMLGVTLPAVFSTTIHFLAAFVFLLCLDRHLAYIVVFILPLCLVLSKLFVVRVRRLTRAIRDTDSDIQSHLLESAQHISLLQSLEQEASTIQRLRQLHCILFSRVKALTRFSVLSNTIVGFAFSAGYTVAFLWGVTGIYEGSVSFGMMTAFLQLVGQIQRPLIDLSHQLPTVVHATASADRLIELEHDERDSVSSPVLLPGVAGICVSHLSFAYSEEEGEVLSDFSHDFKPGSKTAILGETGVGKTTLFRLMLALLRQQQGDIRLYSGTTALPADASTRCNLVYVPQGNSLLSGTIRQNLLMANPAASDAQLCDALHCAVADFVFDLPQGIDTPCAELGVGLSEGQAQRIAIARGLLRPGSVLLLDEFSASLDEATEEELIQHLMHRIKGKTMIFITHRKRVTQYCDEVIELGR